MILDSIANVLVHALIAAPLVGTAIGLVCMVAERKPRGLPTTTDLRAPAGPAPAASALMQATIANASSSPSACRHADVAQQLRAARQVLREKQIARDSRCIPLATSTDGAEPAQVSR
jgi:hypothetical protein